MKKISIIFTVILLFNLLSFSQKIDELKNQQLQIEKKIQQINEQLAITENKKKSASINLALINRKIELKNRLILDLENQENIIKNKVNQLSNSVDSLNFKFLLGIEEYKRFLQYIQKRDFNKPVLLYLLSSSSINEAYRKIVYYNEYLDYQKTILKKLTNTTIVLKEQKSLLNLNLIELNNKENQKLLEIQSLKKTESEQSKIKRELTNRKKELLKELDLNKETAKKLLAEIEKLIEEERIKMLAEKNQKTIDQNKTLSKNFSDNIGKFTLPVSNGIIVSSYGESDHPVLKNIKIKNNGIDIAMTESSDIFSIFNGEVRKIIKIPGSRLAVIIRHGNYLTVYSNLTEVFVKSAQQVRTNEKIGRINLNQKSESQTLHFEIWNENKSENPTRFLRD